MKRILFGFSSIDSLNNNSKKSKSQNDFQDDCSLLKNRQ